MKRPFWNEYKLHIDLYKFYFGIALKANAFFYAVAGAIVLAYYSGKLGGGPGHFPKILLAIPILLSGALAAIFFWGAWLWKKICDQIKTVLEDEDSRTIRVKPKIQFLGQVLVVFGFIFLIAGSLLGYVYWVT